VSPFSTGGHVSHAYNEHSSFVKFVERNWKLSKKLTVRSRDNLPNPIQGNDRDLDDYVPRNMPTMISVIAVTSGPGCCFAKKLAKVFSRPMSSASNFPNFRRHSGQKGRQSPGAHLGGDVGDFSLHLPRARGFQLSTALSDQGQ
jgi:hypothetical protein